MTSSEKPLTNRERLSIVRRRLEKSNDKIIELASYAKKLENKLIQVKMDYNLDDSIIDIDDLINDNL